MSDTILFSANLNLVDFDDARRHLAEHSELYFSVKFKVADPENFSFPVQGLIHISGRQVEYRVTIARILPFSSAHYEDPELSRRVKPIEWLEKWKSNDNGFRSAGWNTSLVFTTLESVSYDTGLLRGLDGSYVKPPRGYQRILPPGEGSEAIDSSPPRNLDTGNLVPLKRAPLAERNLEDFVAQQLESIEPGLRLVQRQCSTSAGRIDLLCKDANDTWVVLELKRATGTDQVIGQILRYMGWIHEHYATTAVRGIIIVGTIDPALSYAAKAAPNIQIKTFKLSFEEQ